MFLLFQSLLVYGLIVIVMTYNGFEAYTRIGTCNSFVYPPQNSTKLDKILCSPYILIPLLLLSLFTSLRYRVGVDSDTYKTIFYEILKTGNVSVTDGVEEGFIALMQICGLISSKHYFAFFIIALIQFILIYIVSIRERYLLPFLGISMILSLYYLNLVNGVRQNICVCAFAVICPLFLKRGIKYKSIFIVLTLCLMSIHKSALFILPLGILAYFLQNKVFQRKTLLTIFLFATILFDQGTSLISDELFDYANFAGYDDQRITAYYELNSLDITFGFRALILYLINVFIIYYFNDISKYFKSAYLNVMFNLFFIGEILHLLFYREFTINRMIMYFNIFTMFMISCLLFYLWIFRKKSSQYYYSFVFVFILLIMYFLYQMYDATNLIGNEYVLFKFDTLGDKLIK